jgi:neutral/alkaline ceramidase-like enzyme
MIHWKVVNSSIARGRAGCLLGYLLLFAIAAEVCAAQDKGLRAGAARVDITPPLESGASAPTGRYEHEHLYVRAIVIDNGTARAALLGADQSSLSEGTWKQASHAIAKELNCPVSNILMSATHTHSPGVPQGPPPATQALGDLDANEQRVVAAMVNAVHQALDKLQPAQMAFGTGNAYLNVNRDAIQPQTHLWTQAPNLVAPSDKTVAVLKFESLSGEPIGAYVNYAMHPINGYLANFTSADFAGAMSRYVEQAYDDKPAVIFSQGASGDQNPLYLRPSTNGMASRSGVPITGNVLVRESVEAPLRDAPEKGVPMDPKVRNGLERWMESEGDVLGEEVIRIMTNANRTERDVRIWSSQTEISCPGRTRTDKGREGMAGTYVDGPPVPIRLGVLGIGDVALTSVDAEVYTLIAQRMKRQSPMANTVVVTLANGRAPSGYIPDDASFSHNTFQALGSRLKAGCAEDSIADGLTKMVTDYTHQEP